MTLTLRGHIEDGKIVVDESVDLPDRGEGVPASDVIADLRKRDR